MCYYKEERPRFDVPGGLPVRSKCCGNIPARQEHLGPNQAKMIEDYTVVSCGDCLFQVCIPDRGQYQCSYQEQLIEYMMFGLHMPASVVSVNATPIRPYNNVGKYRELLHLGSGTFGDVCMLGDSSSGLLYAGKKFKSLGNSVSDEQVQKEVRTLRRLSHVS